MRELLERRADQMGTPPSGLARSRTGLANEVQRSGLRYTVTAIESVDGR